MAENVGESLSKGARVVVTGRLEQRSWETEQGEKRSVVEIVADEIGPSLRFATAKVEKIDRRGGGDFGGGGRRWQRWRRRWGRRQPSPAPAVRRPAVGGGGGGYDEFGEEPF